MWSFSVAGGETPMKDGEEGKTIEKTGEWNPWKSLGSCSWFCGKWNHRGYETGE